MKTKISVVIITKNEEKNIRRCLESVRWVDEIVVVDDFSTDRTMEICREFTDRIFTRKFKGFADQKNFAIGKSTYNWVFSLDADEVVPDDLREEIQDIFDAEKIEYVAFNILCKSYFLKRWMRYGGWYDYNQQGAKIFRKDRCSYYGVIHEKLQMYGRVGYLKRPLTHYGKEDSIEKVIEKMNRYTSAEVDKLIENGEHPSLLYGLVYRPIKRFIGLYIYRRGYKDGVRGFLYSALKAMYQLVIFAKYWERFNTQ